MAGIHISGLQKALEDALPANVNFCYHHISTPPIKCPAIFAAPSGDKPQKTYCESHFLNVSVPSPGDAADKVSIFAIEILLYSTKTLTTVFVSKADSTGYLSLLSLAPGTPSPLRTIAATFIAYIIRSRRRDDTDLVLTLFARAANQYLFPGSSENEKKHVSDDRQLVKWWCRVVDCLMQDNPFRDSHVATDKSGEGGESVTANNDISALSPQAYLTVPGEDSISSFLPNHVRLNPSLRSRWKQGNPLLSLAPHPAAPPRCLVPHLPDDPKARFLDELDDELRDSHANSIQSVEASPSKRGTGQWKSVKTLDQFWEMMAFRQECSSGRLVGFLWVVYPLAKNRVHKSTEAATGVRSSMNAFSQASTNTDKLEDMTAAVNDDSVVSSQISTDELPQSSSKQFKSSNGRKGSNTWNLLASRSGPIIPRLPRIKSNTPASDLSLSLPRFPEWYYWPEEGRGQLVLSERNYKKALEILLRLDFANLAVSARSSKIWMDETGVLAGTKALNWGQEMIGSHITQPLDSTNHEAARPVSMMIVKKRKQTDSEETATPHCPIPQPNNGVNLLGAGLVRKKARVTPVTLETTSSKPG